MWQHHFNRADLSCWLTHFVHDRDQEVDQKIGGLDLRYVPDVRELEAFAKRQADYIARLQREGDTEENEPWNNADCVSPPYSLWSDFEEELNLSATASAFEVLKHIITVGYIRVGWSFRKVRNGKQRPTIYGNRAASCFTEMPLYALIEYARARSDNRRVSLYGIALSRTELFQAGARPVIYGLSAKFSEKQTADGWPRQLSDSCGIGEQEQYRYVSVDPQHNIDFTHEREWRWPFMADHCECPGLPLWLEDSPFPFSTVLILVPTKAEANEILDLLKRLHDAETLYEGEWRYDQQMFLNTRVISLEEVETAVHGKTLEGIRLEDIPQHSIRAFVAPVATRELIDKIKVAVQECRQATEKAGEWYRKFRPDNSQGFWDLYGCAIIYCRSSQSEFLAGLSAIAKEDDSIHVEAFSQGGYAVNGLLADGATKRFTIGESRHVAGAAIKVMNKHFPEVQFEMIDHLN